MLVSGPNIVIDTNVLVSALRSDEGSSYRLLLLVGEGAFDICLSVPVALEYEEVSKRREHQVLWALGDVDDILDYLFAVARWTAVHFKWPVLPDSSDNMLLELAIAGQCDFIVTFNTRDFAGSEQFGIEVCTPFDFLKRIKLNS
jgi:putative PIN family toxin of toxin-antitoxin system